MTQRTHVAGAAVSLGEAGDGDDLPRGLYHLLG